jgi:hypothetical protein
MKGAIRFTDEEEKAELLRRMRLLSEDVAELSSTIAIPLALSTKPSDSGISLRISWKPTGVISHKPRDS